MGERDAETEIPAASGLVVWSSELRYGAVMSIQLEEINLTWHFECSQPGSGTR